MSTTVARDFQAGQMIVHTGADLDFVGILTSGMILAEGQAKTTGPIRLLLPMDMVGRPDRSISSCDLRVVADARICALPFSFIKSYIQRNPEVLIPYLSRTLRLIGNGRQWIWIAYHHDALQKICLFLATIIHTYRRAGLLPAEPPWAIPFPLTRAEIGTFLGMGLFTVSRHLNALKDDGIISFSIGKDLTVVDHIALYRLAQIHGEDLIRLGVPDINFNDLLGF